MIQHFIKCQQSYKEPMLFRNLDFNGDNSNQYSTVHLAVTAFYKIDSVKIGPRTHKIDSVKIGPRTLPTSQITLAAWIKSQE